MSFDLYLSGAEAPVESVLEHLDAYRDFQRQDLSDSSFDYVLVNPATGVYCYFGLGKKGRQEAHANSLCLSLNYNRPVFFAFECMALVENLCRSFNLLVEDPQENFVGQASVADLIKSWRIHNERAVRALHAQGTALTYIPESKATEWWAHTRVKDSITQELGDAVFVPEVFMLRRPAAEPFRMIVWPEGTRQLLPAADVVCIDRSKHTSTQPNEMSRGLVFGNRFLELVAPYTSEYRFGTQTYRLLDPVSRPEVISITRGLELMPMKPPYEKVDSDSYHNVILD